MTFGDDLNEFIGTSKLDTVQPHIVIAKREILSHFRATLLEDQTASGSPKPVGISNAVTATATAVLEIFANNGVTSVNMRTVKT